MVSVAPEGPCGSASPWRGRTSGPQGLEAEVCAGWELGGKSVSAGSPECQGRLLDCCSFNRQERKISDFDLLRLVFSKFRMTCKTTAHYSFTLASWSSPPSVGTAAPPPSPSAPDCSITSQGWQHGGACSLVPDGPSLCLGDRDEKGEIENRVWPYNQKLLPKTHTE